MRDSASKAEREESAMVTFCLFSDFLAGIPVRILTNGKSGRDEKVWYECVISKRDFKNMGYV